MKNKKIKVAFMAPETKWWPYFIYKELVNWLNEKYWNQLEVYFFNSKKDWLKLHFTKFDVIFSVIPFLFKPIWTKKFIFNPRWNWEIEKKKRWLGNKLLYLSKLNLNFSDKIMLTSYFLADKLNFRKKYEDKFIIIPNFIDLKWKKIKIKKLNNKKLNNKEKLNLLTISSTKFLQKWIWIVDLANQVKNIKNYKINWTIIAWWNIKNKEIIEKEFNKIDFPKNISINWIDWIKKNRLNEYYEQSDIFIYWTRLETWGQTILESMNFWLPVILLDYELWKYIYPEDIISNNITEKLNEIIDNHEKYSQLSIDFVKQYDKEKILLKLKKFLEKLI